MSIVKIAATTAVFILVSLSAACNSDDGSTATVEKAILTVYKSPACGCCGAWVDHVNSEGLSTKVENVDDLQAVKNRFGIQPEHRSCHTSVTTDGFVFEGHIPANAIQSFLAKKPKNAIGLAVPGMPMGSPGMEQSDAFTPYQVVQLMKDGSVVPFMTVNHQKEQYK